MTATASDTNNAPLHYRPALLTLNGTREKDYSCATVIQRAAPEATDDTYVSEAFKPKSPGRERTQTGFPKAIDADVAVVRQEGQAVGKPRIHFQRLAICIKLHSDS